MAHKTICSKIVTDLLAALLALKNVTKNDQEVYKTTLREAINAVEIVLRTSSLSKDDIHIIIPALGQILLATAHITELTLPQMIEIGFAYRPSVPHTPAKTSN